MPEGCTHDGPCTIVGNTYQDWLGQVEDQAMANLKSTVRHALKANTDLPEYLDFKIWIGLLLWIGVWYKWGFRHAQHAYLDMVLYSLGLDFICLHLVEFHARSGILCIYCIVFGQCGLAAKVFLKPTEVSSKGFFEAHNVYLDLSCPFAQCCFIFSGQFLFGIFYLYTLLESVNPDDIEYLFFLAAWVCVQMTMYMHRGADNALGERWNFGLSVDLLKNADRFTFIRDRKVNRAARDHDTKVTYREKTNHTRFYMAIRCTMGAIVNSFLHELIAFTVPILLMQFHDPLNCVVYAIGVNFIVTMDAMHPVIYNVEVTGLLAEEAPLSGRANDVTGSTWSAEVARLGSHSNSDTHGSREMVPLQNEQTTE